MEFKSVRLVAFYLDQTIHTQIKKLRTETVEYAWSFYTDATLMSETLCHSVFRDYQSQSAPLISTPPAPRM